MDVHTMFTGGKGRMSFTDRQISVQFKQRDIARVDRHLAKKKTFKDLTAISAQMFTLTLVPFITITHIYNTFSLLFLQNLTSQQVEQ